MSRTLKWGLTILSGAVLFVGTWGLYRWIGMSNGDALAIAAIPSALLTLPMGWWAGREPPPATQDLVVHIHQSPLPQPAPAEGQVVVGLIPYEPPNFQPPEQVAILATMTDTICVVCAVTGQRGVGKTQLAGAYARRRIQDGWLVAWIGAESTDLINAGMDNLADRLHLRNPEDDAETAAARIRDHLQTRRDPSLLIFDNLTDLNDVTSYLPAAGPTQVVITTTARSAEGMGRPVPIDVFDVDTSLRFLHQATRLDDPTGARMLADELGRLPLALAQAAARIRAGWDYPTYLDHFRRYPVDSYLTSRAGDQYPIGAPAAILIALDPFYPHDRELLETLAFLSPDGISRDLVNPTPRIDDSLENLYEASIIEFAGDTTRAITMHRLVQRIIRDRCLHTGTYPQVISRLTMHLRALVIPETDAWRLRQRGDELVRHIDALWDNATQHAEHINLAPILALRIWAVQYLTVTSAVARAIPFARTVATDTKTHLGADHLHTLFAANTLAYTYQTVGRLAEAIAIFERTLTDRRRVLGDDHPDTLSSVNNLALAYQAAGQLAAAIPLHQKAHTDMRRVLGDDHPDTLTAANNLALAYQDAGRLSEAIPLLEQTLTDRRRALGDDHPHTLISANNLALTYQDAGRLSEAIPLLEQTLTDRRRVLGDDHPETLSSAGNLPLAYQAEGRLAEAITLFEQTLTDRRRALGDDHPHTLNSANNLAHAYQAAGRLADAISLFEQTLTEMRRVLGGDHPHTLHAVNNLAHAYQAAGRLADAIPLHRKNLIDRRRVLGHDHPDTLASGNNLASTYYAVGRRVNAISLFEQTLTEMRRVLGDDHPHTLNSANNLAHTYYAVGRLTEATALFDETLTKARNALDESHPLVAIVHRSLQVCRRQSPT